jgi:CHAT domain-containing protein
VERIAALFPQGESKVLFGADATRANVLSAAPGRRFVQFATHTWLDSENPRDTGLRLGAEKPGGGGALLGISDILSLSLSADLVVLSACRSGEGEAVRGEGLAGLTRAFLNAGSRAVVVSLWDVPDRSAADFMEDFYGGLAHGQDAAAALRASKLHFLASQVPGRDRILRWAPFILIGDSGMTSLHSNPPASAATK